MIFPKNYIKRHHLKANMALILSQNKAKEAQNLSALSSYFASKQAINTKFNEFQLYIYTTEYTSL